MPSHESTSFFTVEQAKALDEGSNSSLSGGASGSSRQLGGIFVSSQAEAVPVFGVSGSHIPSVPQLRPAWASVQAARAARGQSPSSGVQANSWGLTARAWPHFSSWASSTALGQDTQGPRGLLQDSDLPGTNAHVPQEASSLPAPQA